MLFLSYFWCWWDSFQRTPRHPWLFLCKPWWFLKCSNLLMNPQFYLVLKLLGYLKLKVLTHKSQAVLRPQSTDLLDSYAILYVANNNNEYIWNHCPYLPTENIIFTHVTSNYCGIQSVQSHRIYILYIVGVLWLRLWQGKQKYNAPPTVHRLTNYRITFVITSVELGSIHIWRQMFLGHFWPT